MNVRQGALFAVFGTIAGIAITMFLVHNLLSSYVEKMDWFATNGINGVLALLLLFILMAIFLFPGSFSKYMSGYLFGFIPGMLFAWVASMIAALFPHFLAKHWLRPWAEKMLKKQQLLQDIETVISEDGWRTVAYTRISLVLPYTVLNYIYGVTSISTSDLLKGNLLMIVPAIVYTWWGSQARIVLDEGFSAQGEGYVWIMTLSIIMTIWLIHHVRKLTLCHISARSERE